MIKTILRNPDQFLQIKTVLEKDVECNLYPLDILENSQQAFVHEWSGVYHQEQLIAVNLSSNRPFPGMPSGLCVPYGDPRGCQLLGEWEQKKGGTRHLFGERGSVDAFYHGMGSPPSKINCEERLFRSETIPEEGTYLKLEVAVLEEKAILIEMSAQMQEEDLGFNPLDKYRESFIQSVYSRIQEERFLVAREDGEIVFLIDIGTQCSFGVQVRNAFVPLKHRRRGLGQKGMRGCLKYFLPDIPVVTLLARESNFAAIKTHHRAGYTPTTAFRMIVMS